MNCITYIEVSTFLHCHDRRDQPLTLQIRRREIGRRLAHGEVPAVRLVVQLLADCLVLLVGEGEAAVLHPLADLLPRDEVVLIVVGQESLLDACRG